VPLTWHPAKIFFIFFKFLCRVPEPGTRQRICLKKPQLLKIALPGAA
jgi:hypothetical protein